MPLRAAAIRLAGGALMGAGVWRRDPPRMAAGAALVGLGWSGGLLGWNAAEPSRKRPAAEDSKKTSG
jgi:hypothetical protein